MSNSKNIDRLFREKFRDFEVEAPKKSWQNISQNINQQTAAKKAALNKTKYYIASYAVVAAIAIGLFSYYNNSDKALRTVVENNVISPVIDNQKTVNNLEDVNSDLLNEAQVIIPTKNNLIRNTRTAHAFSKKQEKKSENDLINTETTDKNLIVEKSIKANIFITGENNEVLKIKTTELSEHDIEKYFNSVKDSANIISETVTKTPKPDSIFVP